MRTRRDTITHQNGITGRKQLFVLYEKRKLENGDIGFSFLVGLKCFRSMVKFSRSLDAKT
jgi:hypothetical protein